MRIPKHLTTVSVCHVLTSLLSLLLMSGFGCSFGYAQPLQWRLASGTSGLYVGAIDIFRSNPDTMCALTDEGVFISSDSGESWNSLPDTIGIWTGILGAIKVDPVDSKRIYISHSSIHSGSNDLSMTTNCGVSWHLINGGGGIGAGAVIEIDPSDCNIVYAGVGSGESSILRTTDRGVSWSFRPHPVPSSMYSLAIDPQNSARIYIAYASGLFKSLDTGSTWSPIVFGFPMRGYVRLAINPVSGAIYATFWPYLSNPGGVFRSTDQGLTWAEMNNGLGPDNRYITWIAINNSKPNQIFLGTSTPNFDTHDLIFISTDSGFHWTALTSGLPGEGHVEMIVIDTASNRIFAAIASTPEARGIYLLDLATEVRENQKTPSEFNLLQNYPNPFNQSTRIPFDINKSGHVVLTLFDTLGRKVKIIAEGSYTAGRHEVELEAGDLASGVYRVRLQFGNQTTEREAVLLK